MSEGREVFEYSCAFEKSKEYFNGEELPAKVFLDKYALKNKKQQLLERTPEDMFHRIASEIHRIEKELVGYFLDGLSQIPEVSVYGPKTAEARTTAVSINVTGWEAAELAYKLDESFGIMGRPGLHCAPYAHRTIGTIHTGTYRLVPGVFSTRDEVDYVLKALEQLARERS